MDIDAAHAAALEQPRRRLDHDRRTGEIGLAAVELVEVRRNRLVDQPMRGRRPRFRSAPA